MAGLEAFMLRESWMTQAVTTSATAAKFSFRSSSGRRAADLAVTTSATAAKFSFDCLSAIRRTISAHTSPKSGATSYAAAK